MPGAIAENPAARATPTLRAETRIVCTQEGITRAVLSVHASSARWPPHEAIVSWNDERGRYEIVRPTLANEQLVGTDGDSQELISVINSNQLLRVVPTERTTIYATTSRT